MINIITLVVKKVAAFPKALCLTLIKGYQKFISPILGPSCRFTPSCSNYAHEAINRHGIVKGCWLTVKRILKCHPLHPGGDDPVPDNTNQYKLRNEK